MSNIFENTELFDGARVFKGIRQVNGLAEDFDESLLIDGYIYFVRTSEDKKHGYIYINGKRYGDSKSIIDCGTY